MGDAGSEILQVARRTRAKLIVNGDSRTQRCSPSDFAHAGDLKIPAQRVASLNPWWEPSECSWAFVRHEVNKAHVAAKVVTVAFRVLG